MRSPTPPKLKVATLARAKIAPPMGTDPKVLGFCTVRRTVVPPCGRPLRRRKVALRPLHVDAPSSFRTAFVALRSNGWCDESPPKQNRPVGLRVLHRPVGPSLPSCGRSLRRRKVAKIARENRASDGNRP